ncbi:DUF3959 family protein [Ectobacillus antri]|uniref:DUF3959 family protein n=1 Tax=Ectobacillus antri TaxID=2486280 RepID=A0ABT6H5W7_9BACI|nr:DUF3959 family protein [Ectobacillus antri]MDG4657071.1 DUF3959 family protein [Ectobacillus antri]MDG5754173.1 DUF3959 family protein [Ectobacillus antri]
MKLFDILLILLSFLLPIAGYIKQFPMTLSIFIGGLLFVTSIGSYMTKRTSSRFWSWITYSAFVTNIFVLRDTFVTVDTLISHAKIAACVAIISFVFKFRTYAVTGALLGLWGAILWDIKETQSLLTLQNMLNTFTTERLYVLLMIGGFLIGGLLSPRRDEEPKKERGKKKRKRSSYRISLPRLPKLPNIHIHKKKPLSRQKQEPKEMDSTINTVDKQLEGQTRMERRKYRS